jgi:nicotinate-nucleotide adenylyltransferase
MRSVIIGGTYNPPHVGHLFLAEELLKETEYERVFLVPSNIPAHKPRSYEIDPAHRLGMLGAALGARRDLVVDDCDIRRGGVSYSVDTVEDITTTYSDITGRLGFVIGDDLVDGFESWKDWKKLVESVDILVARREYQEKVPVPFRHRYLDNRLFPVSSTDIRLRIGSGKAFRYLVTEPVYSYITKNDLYGSGHR